MRHLGITNISFAFIILLLLAAYSFIVNNTLAHAYPFIASTRNFFDVDTGNMIEGTDLPSALSILNVNNICPGELGIYVHGIWATEEDAEEQTERVFLSLLNSGYNIDLIGFSWDSDTPFSLDDINASQYGWKIAKNIANENGRLLAKFIDDFKEQCPADNLRIIAHSLGSRVILSALQSPSDNNTSTSKKITSIHLLGAAIDDEQVSLNQDECRFNIPPLRCSGVAIELEVEHFYNLYNPEDNMLASEEITVGFPPFSYNIVIPSSYQATERGNPLGAYAIENIMDLPVNYKEYNVLPNISYDSDTDKNNICDLQINLRNLGYPFDYYYCTIIKTGDNHFGYMGYRNNMNPQIVSHSGAIDRVVRDWQNENNQ